MNLAHTFALAISLTAANEAAAQINLAEKDLAIVMPNDLQTPLELSGAGDQIFDQAWLRAVQDGFAATSVGAALQSENRLDDWRMVTARLVPCSPISNSTRSPQDIYCWPEIRQVWQPILKDFQGRTIRHDFYADDRAIHVLYDVATAADRDLIAAVKAELALDPTGSTMPAALKSRFAARRDTQADSFISAVTGLRDNAFADSAYMGSWSAARAD